ncbi:hypothetical protein E2C06_25865 [Dankookia rubra]|uniref:Pyridine nucleotide-disulphide oxidoreductase dimerisation domain-containing protein n=1 Tax=Dankookia rubra TaxID=1442381 RepID=A0A4R5QBF6_9PROT|nr:hypothetical protein E2C06_25865 [Dankookia rubra]
MAARHWWRLASQVRRPGGRRRPPPPPEGRPEYLHDTADPDAPVAPRPPLAKLTIRLGLPATDLKGTMFAYPTSASNIGYMLVARELRGFQAAEGLGRCPSPT